MKLYQPIQFLNGLRLEMKSIFTFPLIYFTFALADKCQHPPAAPNFKNSLYAGRWYEIGKVSDLTQG